MKVNIGILGVALLLASCVDEERELVELPSFDDRIITVHCKPSDNDQIPQQEYLSITIDKGVAAAGVEDKLLLKSGKAESSGSVIRIEGDDAGSSRVKIISGIIPDKQGKVTVSLNMMNRKGDVVPLVLDACTLNDLAKN